jgi:DNA polymerase III subunit epsilon
VASPSAQFVTGTRGGQLLRVQLAPVRAIPGDAPAAGVAGVALNGFVLMLDNITRDFAEQSQRDRLLHGLTEGSRASLGNLQAAVEMLDFPDLDADTRARFQGVVRDEVNAMSQRIRELDTHTTQMLKTRWPMEDMLGADLLAAAARRIESLYGCRVALSEVDASLWLEVDSFSLLQALAFLAGRLAQDYAIQSFKLRLAVAGSRAHLDLVWSGLAMSTETVTSWETEPMKAGADVSSLTVRDVVERHGGEFWCERERGLDETFARFLLPLAGEHERLDAKSFARGDGRPEYYDFDLFRTSEQSRELADRKLADLSYTVFDTETTGLDPSKGDEIIQIGATRIVNGKLRRQECFEQLVDPQRTIPAASIPLHGIEPAMVAGQPTIDAVLPAFHAFAHDTVLVGHNAAFDMRFFELKEERTGVRFDQPVLDTLLLSALVHPQQESHQLEAIAERFDVAVLGRHTALGDAMVTAEVFLKLLPLLAEQGIHTLGQARDAAQQTYYARIRY